MVKENEEYIITIDDIGINGEGIGRINNYVVFVKGALPKDIIKISIIKIKKNYAYGEIIKILTSSPFRIEPKCKESYKCGGCLLAHINYDNQLEIKTKKLKDALERIGKITDIKINEIIGMKYPYNYRNKAQYAVGEKNGQIVIGFYEAQSHTLIPITNCKIQHNDNEIILKTITKFMERYKIPPYNIHSHSGLIRNIIIRTSIQAKEIMVVIIINGKKIPHTNELKENLIKLNNIKSLIININTQKTNIIFGDTFQTIWGTSIITDYIGQMKYQISAKSFYQVNPVQTNILYEKIKEYSNLTGFETVLDAYSGVGTIAIYLAKNAKKIIAVEILKESTEDAKQNAILNNITNIEFITGRAEKTIPELCEKQNIDIAIIDPPRTGCNENVLKAIMQMNIKKIIYVSCNPATLARDLNILCREYELKEIQPIDMFCHTTHVETVVLLTR